MPVIRSSEIQMSPVSMDGVKGAAKANVIGPGQGWKDHTLRVFTLEPDGFTPRHQHDWEHINYIIAGKGRLTIGDQTHEVRAGDYAVVPSETEHQFRNPYDEEFKFICIVPQAGA